MLDLVGSIAGMIAIIVNTVAIATILPLGLRGRIVLAAAVGAWVGIASGLAGLGLLAFALNQPVPLLGVLFATPLVVLAIAWRASPKLREVLLKIPTPLLIRLNGFRVLGALFLALAAVGRLGGPFPFSAGVGDIITGALALPVAMLAVRDPTRRGRLVGRWNLFGALDLFAAVGLGLTSANGSPIQLFFFGAGSEAMQHLPFSLVPTVLVPFYLMTHAVIAAQLAHRRSFERNEAPRTAASQQPA
jgi:hypothetical protein